VMLFHVKSSVALTVMITPQREASCAAPLSNQVNAIPAGHAIPALPCTHAYGSVNRMRGI
jgi:hypothetical protein